MHFDYMEHVQFDSTSYYFFFLKRNLKEVLKKKMLIAILIPRAICPRKEKHTHSSAISGTSQTARQRHSPWI